MPQNEQRASHGRRTEDFEAPALAVLVAQHDARILHMREQIAALDRDVARALAHLAIDPLVDTAELKRQLQHVDKALRELLR